jgi:two-component system phosphate regulon response regulator OmpR
MGVVSASAKPQNSEVFRVVVVDDDPKIRRMLAEYLEEQNVSVAAAANGAEMWACLEKSPADVVLLDLVMPGEDGLNIAAELRRRADVGIIMLTGRGDVVDRVVGLEVGADDYLTKPFHLREVLARIKSVARRARSARPPGAPETVSRTGDTLRFNDWQIRLDRRQLIGPDGAEVPLTTGEFDLLVAFAEHPNRVLDRDMLMDLAKGRQWEAFDRAVDTQVARLRRKIEPDPKSPTLIRSVRGIGYLFAADVKRG